MALKRLLVNADDFGLSPAINTGIIRAHLDGIVTSTSIVAAGAAFDEAVALSRLHRKISVGVHLTLVEENAVSDPSEIPSLAPHGVLPQTYGQLMKKVLTAQIPLSEIELELRSQIETCLTAGLRPTHLDSHQHTHALPLLFPLVVRLANDYAIRAVRIPRVWPGFRDVSAQRFAPKCVLSLLAYADGLFFPLGASTATHHFAGLFETGALTEARLLHILRRLHSGTTELVCHPGYADLSGPYEDWGGRRELELATLTSPVISAAIRSLGIEVINYRQL
jgi:predicted glycoside hydrolase/deacetylase ChbG (UPF0249 family)